MDNSMKPIDVGAAILIPQADCSDTPGSFGWMQKQRCIGKKTMSDSYGNRPSYNSSFFNGFHPQFTM